MHTLYKLVFSCSVFCAVAAPAQLVVTVAQPKVVGQKAVVPVELKNNLSEPIQSARAVCFLSDEQGKVLGRSGQWVIGGMKGRPSLAPGTTNVFYFVITADKSFASTNLTADVQFSRVVLEGNRLADVTKQVSVTRAPE
jgi:hypothetical protein